MGYSKRRTHQEWAMIVDAQAQSDQSIKTFCEEQNINAGTFHYWRAKLRQSDKPAEGFITLHTQASTSGVLLLRCGGGLELELPGDYPASALSQLIRDLRC
ncbi:MAG: hypothetical protein AB8H47_02735 [Bacteroidia bacterium]